MFHQSESACGGLTATCRGAYHKASWLFVSLLMFWFILSGCGEEVTCTPTFNAHIEAPDHYSPHHLAQTLRPVEQRRELMNHAKEDPLLFEAIILKAQGILSGWLKYIANRLRKCPCKFIPFPDVATDTDQNAWLCLEYNLGELQSPADYLHFDGIVPDSSALLERFTFVAKQGRRVSEKLSSLDKAEEVLVEDGMTSEADRGVSWLSSEDVAGSVCAFSDPDDIGVPGCDDETVGCLHDASLHSARDEKTVAGVEVCETDFWGAQTEFGEFHSSVSQAEHLALELAKAQGSYWNTLARLMQDDMAGSSQGKDQRKKNLRRTQSVAPVETKFDLSSQEYQDPPTYSVTKADETKVVSLIRIFNLDRKDAEALLVEADGDVSRASRIFCRNRELAKKRSSTLKSTPLSKGIKKHQRKSFTVPTKRSKPPLFLKKAKSKPVPKPKVDLFSFISSAEEDDLTDA